MIDKIQIKSFEEYQDKYKQSIEDPATFWGEIASHFHWMKPWDKVLDWNFKEPKIEWFKGAKLNITQNALDRNLETNPNKIALIWEPNHPEDSAKTFTYQALYEAVCQFANVLKNKGVQKGDRICIYLPMIPELTIAILACARIGAIHSVVFAGFSASSLSDRINDAKAKLVITADGLNRGAKQIPLKSVIDDALKSCSSVETVIVYNCLNWEIDFNPKTDCWWHEEIIGKSKECEPEMMDAEDPLYILYTSGSTGKPKGVVHTCGGYMVGVAYTFINVFQYQENDVYWCTADIGWVTGHSYIVYGPLVSGATTMMFEGIPSFPDAGRFWQIVEKYKVNQFLTAPTAIRSLMAHGTEFIKPYDLSSLKVIGSVGEPINDEAWKWYHKHIGKEKCAVVDNWWQTETGAIMISGLGNLSPQKPTYAGYPIPGIAPVLLDQEGNEIQKPDVEGYLCMKAPWPSMIRTTWGDHQRCKQTYFSHYEGYYFSGDGAKRDKNGMYRIIGRVDDVINVSGHRFGTAEIENAINTHSNVVESAVVGYPHPIKGQSIYAFVLCEEQPANQGDTKNDIRSKVVEQIGKIAVPEKIQLVTGLPKTRSGKIMRRILRKIAEGEIQNIGDVSTLLDPTVVEELIQKRV